ncbi:hypothetical protein SteCoe_37293 [Stentor coeruleus]|uniref:C2H2-type domain-containing protein n=1 Tax=Stentor coeruleus TaxID=5963 RepID=A0A1R2ANC3_9CILI|nr:hypothetical protein SteCoe_37293 [Stentor coeruleus]
MKTSYISCTSPNCRRTFRCLGSLKKHLSTDHCKIKKSEPRGCRCHKIKGTEQFANEHLCTNTDVKLLEHQKHKCKKILKLDNNLNDQMIADSELNKGFIKSLWELASDSQTQDISLHLFFNTNQVQASNALKLPEINKPQSGIKLPSIFD